MSTTKYLLLGALGVATILLLTTDKGKKLRKDLADKAKDNAKKLQDTLADLGKSSANTLSELRDLLSSEVEGLGDDARERIESVINGSAKKAAKMKRTANHMAS